MACGVSTVARLGLLALAVGACRKSESDVDLDPKLDAAVMPSGMGEPDGAAADSAPIDAATDALDAGAEVASDVAVSP